MLTIRKMRIDTHSFPRVYVGLGKLLCSSESSVASIDQDNLLEYFLTRYVKKLQALVSQLSTLL